MKEWALEHPLLAFFIIVFAMSIFECQFVNVLRRWRPLPPPLRATPSLKDEEDEEKSE